MAKTLELPEIKLTAEQRATIKAVLPKIEVGQKQLDRLKRLGVDVSDTEAKFRMSLDMARELLEHF